MYICQLSLEKQNKIEQTLIELGFFQEEIEYAMTFKVSDLEDTIDLSKILN